MTENLSEQFVGELDESEVIPVAPSASCWSMSIAASALARWSVTNGPVPHCVHQTQAGSLLISQAQIMALFAALFHSRLPPQLPWNLCEGVCPVITPHSQREGRSLSH